MVRSVIRSQNSHSAASRRSGGLPAISAALIAPMRDAGHPVRLQPRFVQGLVDAALIGAQRAAALQHQGDAAAILRPRHRCVTMPRRMGRMYGLCVHGPNHSAIS